MSCLVSRKGARDSAVATRVRNFIIEVGCEHADVILKSDQEDAIKALLREVGRQHAAGGGKVLPEDSPVGSSGSNGVAERAVQSVEGQIRVLRAALEERWGGVTLQEDHQIWSYLIEHSSYPLSRCEVGHREALGYSTDEECSYRRLELGELLNPPPE